MQKHSSQMRFGALRCESCRVRARAAPAARTPPAQNEVRPCGADVFIRFRRRERNRSPAVLGERLFERRDGFAKREGVERIDEDVEQRDREERLPRRRRFILSACRSSGRSGDGIRALRLARGRPEPCSHAEGEPEEERKPFESPPRDRPKERFVRTGLRRLLYYRCSFFGMKRRLRDSVNQGVRHGSVAAPIIGSGRRRLYEIRKCGLPSELPSESPHFKRRRALSKAVFYAAALCDTPAEGYGLSSFFDRMRFEIDGRFDSRFSAGRPGGACTIARSIRQFSRIGRRRLGARAQLEGPAAPAKRSKKEHTLKKL